ncbi:uncharacterized protein LOC131614412 [Vicia villosa]|uniref:uncharacterized protein LOC131614412 n=1 Tax=Vicia villosa TaxID=3911 RepID=UPI00273CB4FC|nr:uncharacterized protein LOC131614412 [Vicia villosa]
MVSRNAKKIPSNLSTDENWNNIWNIKTLARVKHLLWRICHDCLLSCMRLRQHHVQCSGACPFCGNNDEDVWHVFFGCLDTYTCWISAGLSNIIDHRTHSFNYVKSLILDICSKEDKNTAGQVAVAIEAMWKNRNDLVSNDAQEDGSKVDWLAYHNWREWFLA